MAKNLPAMQETRVESLGLKDPLEKGTATHSRILAWRIPRTEEPGGGGYSPWCRRVGHDLTTRAAEVVTCFVLPASEFYVNQRALYLFFCDVLLSFIILFVSSIPVVSVLAVSAFSVLCNN